MLAVYNPIKHNVKNIYEELLNNNPDGFNYNLRDYKHMHKKD